MYLRKLELFGFKSFAERTAFEFAPGVTGVVGPNGCGKSNVVDAFKWILGSQSAKGLRGTEMKDVIFNGTQSRKPLGLAEVTLVFDNEQRFFDVDYGEVAITRRLYRSGESEYLINKQKCRLKDIKNLLMDTGFGTTSYSILEQGKIDVLLQASTLDRRVIFEEAAGISKYRARKAETLRSLLRVEENLSRLQDIIDEVDKRIRRVKSQASKARKYREISERLQDLRVRIALEEYSRSVGGRTGLAFEIWWTKLRVERLARLEARLVAGLEKQVGERRGLQDALRELRTLVSEERAARERRSEQIRSGELRLTEIAADRERKTAELASTREALAALASTLEEERGQLEILVLGLDTHREDLDARVDAQIRIQEAHRGLVDELRARREGVVAVIQERSRVANRVVQVTAELGGLQGRAERLARSLAVSRGELEKSRSRETELRASLAELETRRDANRAERDECEKAAGALNQRLEATEAELATRREDLHRKSSRLDVLRSFQERLDGVSSGVAEILRRGDGPDGALPEGWECRGLVASNVRVDREAALAVEAALGREAEALIVESQDGALAILDHVREEGLGGLSVISLDRVDRIDPEHFPRHGGVLGALRDRVEVNPGLEELFDRLLANVVLVEDFSTALALARNGLRPFRLVTLAGEVLDPWGSFSIPGESEPGLISRQSEMRELEEDLGQLEEACAEVEARLDALRRERSALQERTEQHARTGEELARQLVSVESAIGEGQRESERLGRELEVGASEESELAEEIEKRVAEKTGLVRQIEEFDARRAEVEAGVLAIEERIRGAETELATANESLSQARLSLAQSEKEAEGLRGLISRQEANCAEREQRVRDLEADLERARSRSEACQEELTQVRAELEGLLERAGELEDRMAAEEAKDQALAEIEDAFRKEIDRVRVQGQKISQERETLHLRDQEERHKRNTVLERIDEEYHLDLKSLLEQQAEGRTAGSTAAEVGRRLAPVAARLRVVESIVPRVQGRVSRLFAPEGGQVELRSDAERYLDPIEGWDRDVAQREVKELQSKIRKLGNVNLEALEELEELEDRHRFQIDQKRDLVESERNLRAIIGDINAKSRDMFRATFDAVQMHFKELFRKCFGGGKAELVLEEGVDILEAGIDIVARPPGKKLTSLSLMSGGERTMTTIALLLAIFRSRPSPFCVLDEVDAPLDEANVRRFVVLVEEFVQNSQFIIVTHNKTTMAAASRLYGVTMQERGVSKRVAVELDSYDPSSVELSGAAAGVE